MTSHPVKTSSNKAPGFSDADRSQLAEALGSKYRNLLPELEETVAGYLEAKGGAIYRRERLGQAKRYADVAMRLRKRLTLVLNELEEIDGLPFDPGLARLLPMAPAPAAPKSLADIARSGAEPGRRSQRAWIANVRRALFSMIIGIHVWELRASDASCDRPGRKADGSKSLTEWVVYRLRVAGVPLSSDPTEAVAGVMRVVWKAAGIPIPANVQRAIRGPVSRQLARLNSAEENIER